MNRSLTIALTCALLSLPALTALAGPPVARKAAPKSFSAASSAVAGDTAFLLARDAYRAGDIAKLNKAAAQVGDHPLAPYAEYWQLRIKLDERSPEEVEAFLQRQSGTLLADYLRRDWLKSLAKKGDWERFRAQRPLLVNDDDDVACYTLAARWQQQDESALAELKTIWRAPRELPDSCANLVQAALAQPGPVPAPGETPAPSRWDTAQLWERFRILTEANLNTAAKRLLNTLPRGEAPDTKQVDAVLASPVKYLERPAPDLSRRSARELYILAVSRVARNDPQLAASYWDGKARERFSVLDQAYVLGLVATSAARKHMPEAVRWYKEVAAMGANSALSDDQLGWRARIALRQGNWNEVLNAVAAMSPAGRADSTWIYWMGRAYQANGGEATAKAQFERIADEHSFYGRLASEELGRPFLLPDNAPGPSKAEVAAAEGNPGLQRALALYRLEMRTEGTREWLWALRGMDDRSLLAAAELARSREIWDRAINTADRTQKEHNFAVRYLAPYRDILGSAAKERAVDEPLVLGVVRQESRFMYFAKSGVGASGLMQLMPATAAWAARKMGMPNYAWSRVHLPEVNAKLGTFYLRQVLDELDGLPVVAAAAYNAGPGRARRWRDVRPLEGAIYAETIPFNETRDYAKKVMANSIYYAALLGETRSLKQRLGVVGARPGDDALVAQKADPLP